jgi:hypothetical protein
MMKDLRELSADLDILYKKIRPRVVCWFSACLCGGQIFLG